MVGVVGGLAAQCAAAYNVVGLWSFVLRLRCCLVVCVCGAGCCLSCCLLRHAGKEWSARDTGVDRKAIPLNLMFVLTYIVLSALPDVFTAI